MSRTQENARLAKLAKAGCVDSFTQLVARNQSRLLCFLSFHCRDRHALEDAAQEAFLQAYLHLDQFDAERSFTSWLFTIARRLLLKRRALALVDEAELGALVSREGLPGEALNAREDRTQLWNEIRAATNDDEFDLLWMVYAEEMPIGEAAETLSLSYVACKKRLSRLRLRLRTQLSDSERREDVALTMRRAG